MISRKHSIAGLSLALVFAVTMSSHAAGGPKKDKDLAAGKKLTPEQSALIDKAIVREKVVIKEVKARTPLVETYIQNMRPDPVMRQVPDSDQHFLGRVEFNKVIGDQSFKEGAKAGGKKESTMGHIMGSLNFIKGLGGSLHLQFQEAGFVQMILMDSNTTSTSSTITSISFVTISLEPFRPLCSTSRRRPRAARDAFSVASGWRSRTAMSFGSTVIVAGSEKDYHEFFHFDSWRTNIQPDLWLPTSFYVEESDPKSVTSTLKFKAINHVWGYVLKVPATSAEVATIDVEGAKDESQTSSDLSPRGQQIAFEQEAEDNVVERLCPGRAARCSKRDRHHVADAGNEHPRV